MATIIADPADTAVALILTIDAEGVGGISGLTPTVAIRRTSDGFYLDWSINTFLPAGWVLQYAPMTESERGHYYRMLDVAAAGAAINDWWGAEYNVNEPGVVGDAHDEIGFAIAGSGGLTPAQDIRLLELYRIHGLELGSPMIVSATARDTTGIAQTIAEVGTDVIVTRT